jgi:lysophospholipase L1-like esterase
MRRVVQPSDSRREGRLLAIAAVAACAALALLVHAYLANRTGGFYAGLLAAAASLVGASWLLARRGSQESVVALNTAIALLIGVALVDLAGSWREARAESRPLKPVYTYSAAKADPAAFERWWKRANTRYRDGGAGLVVRDPSRQPPIRLRPGARVTNHEAEMRINALGFRGPDFDREKGERFRIVALGESTTFGLTVLAGDRPWPEIPQDKIAATLDCDAEVEVVNAGVPGFTIASNVARLDQDILPLAPDLLISYHGYNGFSDLLGGLASTRVEESPLLPERPSWLLERVETAVRVAIARRRLAPGPLPAESISPKAIARSRYARHYAQLIIKARRSGVEVALCPFNLAIDQRSPDEVVRFYERVYPAARGALRANQLHTRLVRDLASRTEARFVEVRAGIDGEYEKYFIDLVHFNQAGRERLAENMLDGIREVLASHPRARCRPRAAAGE